MANHRYRFYICRENQEMPSYSYPAFLLFEDRWNDYGVGSLFELRYVHSNTSCSVEIGKVKIIVRSQEPGTISQPRYTADYVKSSFSSLDELGGGCSLGQDEKYYRNLWKVFKAKEEILDFLETISDCALYHDNYDRMANHDCFHSLVRYDSAEQMLRTARLFVYAESKPDLYSMNYSFHVPYNHEKLLSVKFDFREKERLIPRRLYAIIGENGTGKTHLLNQLTLQYLGKDISAFGGNEGDIPPYSKIIRVSTSFFDNYKEPEHHNMCEFKYCGFRRHDIEGVADINEILKRRLREAISKIRKEKQKEDGVYKFYRILSMFLSEDLMGRMYNGYDFNEDMVAECVNDRMSSGESNMFFMIADILANIRLNSLILFDEPELHMHPNAVTIFMNILYSILDEYQSFAIIATHSPLIVREILGENVYVLEKNEDYPSIRSIGVESFAANLTELYEEIFANKDVPRYYESLLDKLQEEQKTYQEVLANLRSEHLEPNLNMRLMIMNRFYNDEED